MRFLPAGVLLQLHHFLLVLLNLKMDLVLLCHRQQTGTGELVLQSLDLADQVLDSTKWCDHEVPYDGDG